jgi:hypothetical protein
MGVASMLAGRELDPGSMGFCCCTLFVRCSGVFLALFGLLRTLAGGALVSSATGTNSHLCRKLLHLLQVELPESGSHRAFRLRQRAVTAGQRLPLMLDRACQRRARRCREKVLCRIGTYCKHAESADMTIWRPCFWTMSLPLRPTSSGWPK